MVIILISNYLGGNSYFKVYILFLLAAIYVSVPAMVEKYQHV